MQAEFNFFHHWYPVSPIEDLPQDRPCAITLLGLPLVVWKPAASTSFRVFLDRCPHRLAPLSEGRIDEKTGNLMCSYHGWQFSDRGECTSIPQGEKPEFLAKNASNFCLTTFPTREANDLLWVWPDAETPELAAATALSLSPQIDAEKGFVWSSYVRDLEYDWQTLVENIVDPSHVPFAHHGVQGNRDRVQPINLEISTKTPDKIEAKTPGGLPTTITFLPPCLVEYAISFSEDKQVGLVVYCLPVAPGKSRIVAQFPRNFAKSLHRLIPRWWEHIQTRNLVLDGDMILLHRQMHFLQQATHSESWKTAYKLPTRADRFIIEFRQWFDKYGRGQLPWQEDELNSSSAGAIASDRRDLLDRYRQHTVHCHSCRQSLQGIKRIQFLLLGYGAIALVVSTWFPDTARLTYSVPLGISAFFALGVWAWLRFRLEPKFYFIDYIHAEKK